MLGALVDVGLEPEKLKAVLAGLPVNDYELKVEKVQRGVLAATRVVVNVQGGQPVRRLAEIYAVLDGSGLSPSAIEIAKAVFKRLFAAEAKVHGVRLEDAHIHELGAVDTLVDVVGAVAGLELLGIDELWISPLPCPRGWVSTEHGAIPVPAPAVMELLCGVPVYGVEQENELVTPTGAALAVTLARGFGPMPFMQPSRVGYGAGTRDLPRPNVVRLVVGDARSVDGKENELIGLRTPFGGNSCEINWEPGIHEVPFRADAELVGVLEAAIDDMNPEFCSYIAERLRALGALDVYWTPLYMKKGRPGVLLCTIVPPQAVAQAAECIFAESTTLGVRWRLENRLALVRDWLNVYVGGESIRVKISVWHNHGSEQPRWHLAPEYEDCRKAACRLGMPIRQVYSIAEKEGLVLLEEKIGLNR